MTREKRGKIGAKGQITIGLLVTPIGWSNKHDVHYDWLPFPTQIWNKDDAKAKQAQHYYLLSRR